MKKTLFAAAIATMFAATAVQADHHAVYEATDNTFASKLCEVAGNQGLSAAKSFAKENGTDFEWVARSITCNDTPIKKLARDVRVKTASTAPSVQLVATVSDRDTRLCVEAVSSPEVKRLLRSSAYQGLACNGKPVSEFVREVRQSSI